MAHKPYRVKKLKHGWGAYSQFPMRHAPSVLLITGPTLDFVMDKLCELIRASPAWHAEGQDSDAYSQ